jgi:Cu/Ag efflux protein CusF
LSARPPSRLAAGSTAWLLCLLAAALSVSCGRRPQAENAPTPTPQAADASASPIPWATIEPPTQGGTAAAPAQGATTESPAQTPAPIATPKARKSSNAKSYSGTGVVRLINLEEGWLEIDHEEIKGFMPAMQMEWSVTDREMLKSVQVGDKVNFTVEDDNGTEFITELKKAPANP